MDIGPRIHEQTFLCFVQQCIKCKDVYRDDVKLHLLVKTFCLPMLTYCVAALDLSKQNIRDLAVC